MESCSEVLAPVVEVGTDLDTCFAANEAVQVVVTEQATRKKILEHYEAVDIVIDLAVGAVEYCCMAAYWRSSWGQENVDSGLRTAGSSGFETHPELLR